MRANSMDKKRSHFLGVIIQMGIESIPMGFGVGKNQNNYFSKGAFHRP